MKSRRYMSVSIPALLLAIAVAAAPARTAEAQCDVTSFDRMIMNTTVNSDVFIMTGEAVLIRNAVITGSVKMTTGPSEVTHVTVDNDSQINGSIIATSANAHGDASVCVRDDGGMVGTVVFGPIAVEKGTGNSGIEIRDNVEIFGAVSMDKSDIGDPPPDCAGDFTIMGTNGLRPILRSDSAAAGACTVDIERADLNSDFQADGTTGDVTVRGITSSGDVQVQNSIGDVFVEEINSTSDISVDGANLVEWTNDSGTGGDAGFSNIFTLLIDNVSNVNGLLSIGPADTVTVTNSTIKNGIEADVPRDITITDNIFPQGGVLVSGSLNEDIYLSEKAVVERNTLGGGSLTVTQVRDVTVNDNDVDKGNLTVLQSLNCNVTGNTVPAGNAVAPGCTGDVGGDPVVDTMECTGTLDNLSFPGGGELASGGFYWCDEDKVFGSNGEVQAGGAANAGFADLGAATAAAEAKLSSGKLYSTARWTGTTWDMELDHVTPTP